MPRRSGLRRDRLHVEDGCFIQPSGPVMDEGSDAPLFSEAQWTLDFGNTVEQIMSTVRAVGRFECLAMVKGVRVRVTRVPPAGRNSTTQRQVRSSTPSRCRSRWPAETASSSSSTGTCSARRPSPARRSAR
jgi:hypothetical protein